MGFKVQIVNFLGLVARVCLLEVPNANSIFAIFRVLFEALFMMMKVRKKYEMSDLKILAN